MARVKWWCLAAVLLVLSGCGQGSQLVRISTDPPGGTVFYNEKVMGETPLDVVVEQKSGDYNYYSFRVVKENYKPVEKVFKELFYYQKIRDIIPDKLHFVLEERKRFPIAISSEPSGAAISLNGEMLGKTPFTTIVEEAAGKPRVFNFVADMQGYRQEMIVLREFLPKDDGKVFIFPDNLHFDLKIK
ncbi:MAG: PEGA domain-containing protein [Desulforhopalus sp.]|nr:PEGA domain-containing protein [Desulforhopalus sp.]